MCHRTNSSLILLVVSGTVGIATMGTAGAGWAQEQPATSRAQAVPPGSSSPGAPAQASPTAPPASVSLPADGITLPLVTGTRLPAVEVFVGDAGPFRFVVEWAGNVFAVSNAVREAAGLEAIGRIRGGPSGPSGREREIVAVPELRLGEARFEGLVAAVPPWLDRTDHDGVLGLNVFREIVATLDLPGSTLRLSRTPLPPPRDDPSVVDYSPGPGGSPRVPITLAGKSLLGVLDTAAQSALILDESFLPQFEFAEEPRPGPRIFTPGMGELETIEGTIDGDLVVGAAHSPRPLAVFHRMRKPEVLLGGGFLRDYRLTLDQANRRLRLEGISPP